MRLLTEEIVTLALAERLDTETQAQLETVAQDLLANQANGLRLDLAQRTYTNSIGLRAVLGLARDLRARKGAFHLTHLQPQIRKVSDIAASLPVDSIFASVAEADA